MLEKMKAFWNSLDNNVVIHQRELFLGVTACTLAGVLAGMLLSPKKTVTIGSNSGNDNTGNAAALGDTDGEETCE